MLVGALPRDSATVRSVLGEAADWGATDHLLAGLFDAVNAGNWQRGGGKGPRPKPLHRPGAKDDQQFGKARPIEEIKALLVDWNAGKFEGSTKTKRRTVR